MHLDTVTTILISSFGAIFMMVLAFGAFWFRASRDTEKEGQIKLEESIKNQQDKLDKNIEKQTESLNTLARSVSELSYVIKSIKDHVDLKTNHVDRTLSEHWAEIELLRDSRHEMANWLTAIRLQGETKSGWVFSKEWILPKMGPVKVKI